MHGRPVVLALALLAAGCVMPGAQLDPSAAAAGLDAIGIAGATREVLPGGDVLFRIAAETAGFEEYEFHVPAGVTYVEAVVRADGPFGITLADKESKLNLCNQQTMAGWVTRAKETRCTAIAGPDADREWLVRVTNQVGGAPIVPVDDLLGVLPSGDAPPLPFEAEVTFSTRPLDGSAALLKMDALSRPDSEAGEVETFEVPSTLDGALLFVEVVRPKSDAKVPVILDASPYNGPPRNAVGIARQAQSIYYAQHGYAFATMDLRGTGKSDGCYSLRSAADPVDVASVVEFLAEQEWSSGKVGTYGQSYDGYGALAPAYAKAEHLAAVFAVAPGVDMYANYLPGGADAGVTIWNPVGYTSGSAASTPADEAPPEAVLHTADAFCDPTIWQGTLDERHLYDAWWAERNITTNAADIKVPVYLEQGFWDLNVKANYVPYFFNELGGPKRGTFGSYEHRHTPRADDMVMRLAWFDHWLKGRDTGILDAPQMEVLTQTREWRAGDAWPAPDPAEVVFADLASGELWMLPGAAPADMGIGGETDELADPLYWSGVGHADIEIMLPLGGAPQFEVRVFEVRDEDETFAGIGWYNAAHRPDHGTFAPLAPGEVATISVPLMPQDHLVRVGSKLRVELRAVDDAWGGPGGALLPGGPAEVRSLSLRMPTLPVATLAPQPRSAS